MQYDTAASLLSRTLAARYRGRTILTEAGQPFKVHRVDVWNDSPDPRWTITFYSKDECSTHLPPMQQRSVYPDGELPEVWPDSIT